MSFLNLLYSSSMKFNTVLSFETRQWWHPNCCSSTGRTRYKMQFQVLKVNMINDDVCWIAHFSHLHTLSLVFRRIVMVCASESWRGLSKLYQENYREKHTLLVLRWNVYLLLCLQSLLDIKSCKFFFTNFLSVNLSVK